MKLLTGQLAPTKGNVARQPGLRIALLDQHRHLPPEMSLWDVVADAFAELRLLEVSLAKQAANLEHDHGEAAMEKYGRDLERFEREGGYQFASTVDSVLMGVGFDPDFVSWPVHDTARLTEAFRRSVLRLFVRVELFDEDQAAGMLTWPHSGFHVHTPRRPPDRDRGHVARLAFGYVQLQLGARGGGGHDPAGSDIRQLIVDRLPHVDLVHQIVPSRSLR